MLYITAVLSIHPWFIPGSGMYLRYTDIFLEEGKRTENICISLLLFSFLSVLVHFQFWDGFLSCWQIATKVNNLFDSILTISWSCALFWSSQCRWWEHWHGEKTSPWCSRHFYFSPANTSRNHGAAFLTQVLSKTHGWLLERCGAGIFLSHSASFFALLLMCVKMLGAPANSQLTLGKVRLLLWHAAWAELSSYSRSEKSQHADEPWCLDTLQLFLCSVQCVAKYLSKYTGESDACICLRAKAVNCVCSLSSMSPPDLIFLTKSAWLYQWRQEHIVTAVGSSTTVCLLLNLVKISGKFPLLYTYIYFYPCPPYSYKLICFWANKMYHGWIPLSCACVGHQE